MTCPVCSAPATPPKCGTCGRPALAPFEGTDLLVLDGVRHTYGSGPGEVHALREVDMRVRRGEITLIVGPSGGGKTTALLVMGLLLKPTAGQVRLAGQSMEDASESERTRARLLQLGFVFQQFNLIKSLTARENVMVPMRYAGVSKKHAGERASEVLTALGLGHRVDHRPADLSGGEKQRVAVARALALGPQVVLADEPTANLDSVAGQRVVEKLAELASANGTSVVIVTHDTRLAPIADRLLRLEDGALVEQDVSAFAGGHP
jgi:ABC-type lipoprotein export system ATPase subunit